MNNPIGCEQQGPVGRAQRPPCRTRDLVVASLRRLEDSEVSLVQAAARMQLTLTLLGASYKRLGKIAQGEPAGAARAQPPVRPATGLALDWVAGGMIDMAGWQHPGEAFRAAGEGLVGARRHANDAGDAGSDAAGSPSAGPLALRAADLACLAQAAILLGLSNAAEALTTAAYHVLNGDVAAGVDEATAALRTALAVVKRMPLSEL